MLAINVQESTTTTGTGDITLAGVSEDGRTFTSQFAVDSPLFYFIDDRSGNWEHGIGVLSSSTILVRTTFISSSTGSSVNFSAGTKQVFNGYPSSSIVKPKLESGRRIVSPHITDTDTSSNISTSRQTYSPFIVEQEVTFDSIGVSISIASSTGTFHLALYESTTELYPGKRIVNTSANSSTTTGLFVIGITPIKLKPGMYWFGFWNEETASYRGYSISAAYNVGIGANDPNLFNSSGFNLSGQAGLSEMPAIAPSSMGASTVALPTVFMDVE